MLSAWVYVWNLLRTYIYIYVRWHTVYIQFSRHVNFKDVTNRDFIFEDHQVSCPLIHASQSLPVKFWGWNFADGQFTMKTSKITSLKNLYVYGSRMTFTKESSTVVYHVIRITLKLCMWLHIPLLLYAERAISMLLHW